MGILNFYLSGLSEFPRFSFQLKFEIVENCSFPKTNLSVRDIKSLQGERSSLVQAAAVEDKLTVLRKELLVVISNGKIFNFMNRCWLF